LKSVPLDFNIHPPVGDAVHFAANATISLDVELKRLR